MRWLRSQRVARTMRMNGLLSRRFGWSRNAPTIARALGSRSAVPWSLPFARAVARWQRRRGFRRIDGVLSPQQWMLLRQSLYAGHPPEPPPDQIDPASMAPPAMAAAEPAAPAVDMAADPGVAGWASPPVGADQPDAAAAPPEDNGSGDGPDAPPADGGDTAGEWYELARWAQ